MHTILNKLFYFRAKYKTGKTMEKAIKKGLPHSGNPFISGW